MPSGTRSRSAVLGGERLHPFQGPKRSVVLCFSVVGGSAGLSCLYLPIGILAGPLEPKIHCLPSGFLLV